MDTKAKDDEKFEELEKLTAEIDVWIDEENYENVYRSLVPLDGSLVDNCLFINPHCTHGSDDKWIQALGSNNALPIQKAIITRTDTTDSTKQTDLEISLTENEDSIFKAWSQLLYAKLLRAHIQEKGTDCYLRRLDDVTTYLENHLPAITPADQDTTKVTILYLLELSAASLGFEILGFAKRARRVLIREHSKIGEEYYWYYDLLASYNMGIAYFHENRYRKAISEFNRIISEVRLEKTKAKKSKDSEAKIEFFDIRSGDLLLFLPSVIYRADIQLKLQLAYHSIETLDRYFRKMDIKGGVSYKEIRATLIEAEANQQMEDLNKSKGHLRDAYDQLNNLENVPKQVGEVEEENDFRPSPEQLEKFINNHQHQGIKERFLDLFVGHHITLLEESLAKESDEIPRLQTIQEVFLETYFKVVQFNAFDRRGYYQGLMRYLSSLARVPLTVEDYEKKGETHISEAEVNEVIEKAKELYKIRKEGLLQKEEVKKDLECVDCHWQGVDLISLDPEHYKWFTDDMLQFYEKVIALHNEEKFKGNLKKENFEADKEEFLKRLIKVEREYREGLRINDLELRYKSKGVKDKLVSGKCGCTLCLKDLFKNPKSFNEAFAGLLACVQADEYRDEKLNFQQYEQIMKQWNSRFKIHLKHVSNHQRHDNGLFFIGLQRWNSASPAQGRSVGGGYLLYHTDDYGSVDLGIVIDPGFDFLRNLFHNGFGLSDIDIILISHAHMDHIRDFESIVVLLQQLKKIAAKKRVIHVILTLGAYERLKHIIEDPILRYYIAPYIIDTHREIDPQYFENLPSCNDSFRFKTVESIKHSNQSVRYEVMLPPKDNTLASTRNGPQIEVSIRPTRAYHPDPSNYSDSFGFLIEVYIPKKLPESETETPSYDTVTLGYTGDTKWVYPDIFDPLTDTHNKRDINDISIQYSKCDAVVIHLGSLIDSDGNKSFEYYNQYNTDGEECENLVREKDHPYMVGMLRLLSSLYSYKEPGGDNQLVLLGEFGEELRGGIRVDLIERLKQAYYQHLNFLPLDVGVDIQLWHKQDSRSSRSQTKQMVWCVQCKEFVSIDEASFEPYGEDEALYCVCKTCKKATPMNVLQDRLRQLYEVGLELRTYDRK